ncbi:N-acetyltransferase family protein [Halanaerobaculum tunisiense]
MKVRQAKLTDLERITNIYNHAIKNTVATFDTKPKTKKEQLKWFKAHNKQFPILVAIDKGKIKGWVALSRFSSKAGYDQTAEISIYVAQGFRRQGIGQLLMTEIITYGQQKTDLHTIIAKIAGNNQASCKLHSNFDFKQIGTMKETGYKFEEYIDVHLYQKILD